MEPTPREQIKLFAHVLTEVLVYAFFITIAVVAFT
jgi:hypothetical protein